MAEYNIERSIDGVGWTLVSSMTATGAARYRYVDRGLVANTSYFYRVRTSNKLGGLSRTTADVVIASPVVRAGTGSFVPKQNGTPWAATNVIQAEDFDRGGQDVGYKDNTASGTGNTGGHAYRKKPDNAVDALDGDADISLSGPDVWLDDLSTGEWAKYTINVPRSGLYNVNLRMGGSAGALKIDFDGEKSIQGSIAAGGAGWRNVVLSFTNLVALNAGEHVVKIEATSGSIDLDSFNLVERVGFYADTREVKISGDSGANNFHITRSGSVAKFSEGIAASAAPLNIDVNSFTLVTFNGGSGADLLTLDMSGDERRPAQRLGRSQRYSW